jgi:hypothetical protein
MPAGHVYGSQGFLAGETVFVHFRLLLAFNACDNALRAGLVFDW